MKAKFLVLVVSIVVSERLSPTQTPSSSMTSTQVLHRFGAIHWETGPPRRAFIERSSQTIFPTLTHSSPRSRR
jgi:hypothetical protein